MANVYEMSLSTGNLNLQRTSPSQLVNLWNWTIDAWLKLKIKLTEIVAINELANWISSVGSGDARFVP
jgi:hypothetical protein